MKRKYLKKVNTVLSNIKMLRELRHLSQQDLAGHLGVSQAAYSKLEGGMTKLSLSHIFLLAEILDVDMVILVGQVVKPGN